MQLRAVLCSPSDFLRCLERVSCVCRLQIHVGIASLLLLWGLYCRLLSQAGRHHSLRNVFGIVLHLHHCVILHQRAEALLALLSMVPALHCAHSFAHLLNILCCHRPVYRLDGVLCVSERPLVAHGIGIGGNHVGRVNHEERPPKVGETYCSCSRSDLLSLKKGL